jgi:hypothetical protein
VADSRPPKPPLAVFLSIMGMFIGAAVGAGCIAPAISGKPLGSEFTRLELLVAVIVGYLGFKLGSWVGRRAQQAEPPK